MADRKFYRTVVKVEILSEDHIVGLDDIHGIAHAITEGDCSGVVEIVSSDEVPRAEIAGLLRHQGSDPEFFMLDSDGNDLES